MSPSEVYIGNIDSDDYETADYNLYLTYDAKLTKEEKTINLPIKVTYSDANNEKYTDEYNLDLILYEPKKLGIGNGHQAPIFVIIILAVIGFFVYRGFRSRKKKK